MAKNEKKIVYNVEVKSDNTGLKDLNTETTKTKENIDGIGKSAESSKGKTGGFFSSMKGGIQGIGKAFIATGIGAIIILIVGAVQQLYKAFQRTGQGQEALAKGMGVLKGILATVMQVFNSFAKIVMAAFNNPKKAWEDFKDSLTNGWNFVKSQVIDRASGAFDIMAGNIALSFAKISLAWNKLWNDTEGIKEAEKSIDEANARIVEGTMKIVEANQAVVDVVNEVKGIFIELTEEAKKNIKIAQSIELMELNFKRLTASLTKQNSELEKNKLILEQIADDATLSLKEREEAAIKIIDLDTKLAENKLKLAKNEENILRRKMELQGDNSIQSIQELADLTDARKIAEGELVVNVANAEKRIREIRSDNFEIALDAEIDFTEKKMNELVKQIANEKTSNEDKLKALDELEKLTAESYDRQIDMFNTLTDNKIDKNKIAELSDAEQVKAYLDGLGLSEVLTNRFLVDVVNGQIDMNQTKKDSNEEYLDTVAEQKAKEEELAKTTAEKEKEINDKKNKELSEQDKKAQLLKEEEMMNNLNRAMEANQLFMDFNNALLDAELIKITNKYNTETELLNNKYKDEEKQLKQQLKNGLITQEEYDNKISDLTNNQAKESEALAKSLKDSEDAARKDTFEKNKKFQMAEVIMNTASAIISTWAGYATMGPAGTILAAIQTAAIAGIGITQLDNISNTQYQAATGGKIFGDLHAQASGGVRLSPSLMAEGGEFIINRASTQQYEPLLNAINGAGNGNGDTSTVKEIIDYNRLAAAINDKKVYIVSSEISEQQDIDKAIIQNSTF